MDEKSIIKALCDAKKGFKQIVKDKTNPFFKSKYADLENYLEATQDSLCSNGLFISQTIEDNQLLTTIHHAFSEKTIVSRISIRETKTPQELGSQLTYLRRYSYAAILGLASEDDDANSTSKDVDTSVLPRIKEAFVKSKDNIKFLELAQKKLESENQDAADYQAALDWIIKTKNEIIKKGANNE